MFCYFPWTIRLWPIRGCESLWSLLWLYKSFARLFFCFYFSQRGEAVGFFFSSVRWEIKLLSRGVRHVYLVSAEPPCRREVKSTGSLPLGEGDVLNDYLTVFPQMATFDLLIYFPPPSLLWLGAKVRASDGALIKWPMTIRATGPKAL